MLNLKVREFQESPELLQKPKMAMGGRIGLEGGTNEQLYKEYLEDKRRQKVAEQKTMAANDRDWETNTSAHSHLRFL